MQKEEIMFYNTFGFSQAVFVISSFCYSQSTCLLNSPKMLYSNVLVNKIMFWIT